MYKHLEHPADIYIEVYGCTLEEIIKNSALALYDLICSKERIERTESRRIVMSWETKEDLLVNFLNELLYIFDSEKFVASDILVKLNEMRLEAELYGEKYSREKHGIGYEIKAATYHGLELEPSKCYARILFDI